MNGLISLGKIVSFRSLNRRNGSLQCRLKIHTWNIVSSVCKWCCLFFGCFFSQKAWTSFSSIESLLTLNTCLALFVAVLVGERQPRTFSCPCEATSCSRAPDPSLHNMSALCLSLCKRCISNHLSTSDSESVLFCIHMGVKKTANMRKIIFYYHRCWLSDWRTAQIWTETLEAAFSPAQLHFWCHQTLPLTSCVWLQCEVLAQPVGVAAGNEMTVCWLKLALLTSKLLTGLLKRLRHLSPTLFLFDSVVVVPRGNIEKAAVWFLSYAFTHSVICWSTLRNMSYEMSNWAGRYEHFWHARFVVEVSRMSLE